MDQYTNKHPLLSFLNIQCHLQFEAILLFQSLITSLAKRHKAMHCCLYRRVLWQINEPVNDYYHLIACSNPNTLVSLAENNNKREAISKGTIHLERVCFAVALGKINTFRTNWVNDLSRRNDGNDFY
jgi:hypothetical protein